MRKPISIVTTNGQLIALTDDHRIYTWYKNKWTLIPNVPQDDYTCGEYLTAERKKGVPFETLEVGKLYRSRRGITVKITQQLSSINLNDLNYHFVGQDILTNSINLYTKKGFYWETGVQDDGDLIELIE